MNSEKAEFDGSYCIEYSDRSVQVYDLISIMEVIPYLILSIGSIIIYIRSGKSLAASYLYHSSVHLVIFITTMRSSFNF